MSAEPLLVSITEFGRLIGVGTIQRTADERYVCGDH